MSSPSLHFKGRHFDSCVSRCYYALFHLMIAFLEEQGIRSEEWGHQFVPSEFGRLFVHRRKVFSKESHAMVYTIQRERNEADYNVHPVSAKRAKRVFDKICGTLFTRKSNMNRKKKNGRELLKRVNKLIRAAKKVYPKVTYKVIIPGTWEYDATIKFFSPAKYEDKLDRVLDPMAAHMSFDEGYFIGALTLTNGRTAS